MSLTLSGRSSAPEHPSSSSAILQLHALQVSLKKKKKYLMRIILRQWAIGTRSEEIRRNKQQATTLRHLVIRFGGTLMHGL